MRDLFDVLLRDHRDLQALCWDLEWVAHRGDHESATRLVGELAIALVEHGRIEELLLCRRVDGCSDELDEAVRSARAGHRAIEHRLLEICAMSPDQPGWRDELLVIRDTLSERVDDEEGDLFVLASGELEAGEALLLGERAAHLLSARRDEEEDEIALDDGDLEELVEYEEQLATG